MNTFVTGDLSTVTSLVAADYVDHQGLPGVEIRGPDGFSRVVKSARANSAELRVQIEDLIAQTDKVAVRINWNGTLLGEPFNRETIDIIRFSNGQMIEHWGAELWVSPPPNIAPKA